MKKYFSIVIPLAPWRDAEIVSYLHKQNFPKDKFEIIIEKGLNVPINRNNGFKKAKGQIIIFLDDDAFIEPDFLQKVDSIFKKHPEIDVLGGPQLTPKSDKLFAKANGCALASVWGAPVGYQRYRRGKTTLNANSSHITGALMICRRRVLEKITFDQKIYPRDDVVFVEKAKSKGFKIAYFNELYLYHRRRASLKSLIHQVFHYARSRSMRKVSDYSAKELPFLIPALFLIYLLAVPFLASYSFLFFAPLISYLFCTLLFSLYEGFSQKMPETMILLPFMFLVIHLSYGAGFITGFILQIKNSLLGK